MKLIEAESELIAREQCEKALGRLPPECDHLLQFIEKQVGVGLACPVPCDWRGWLAWRRQGCATVVCRGRAFPSGGLFPKWRAGLDVPFGADSVSEYLRGFDVTPVQDLDHLLVNFGAGEELKVFLWYGENLAAYRLLYQGAVGDDPHHELSEAVVQACLWILARPKEKTLSDYLKEIERRL